jgi:hypothetical protein
MILALFFRGVPWQDRLRIAALRGQRKRLRQVRGPRRAWNALLQWFTV